MEIVLLVVIGLIAKNFKSILEFLAEQGQQYGTPPFSKNTGGQPNLSKKVPVDFSYEDEYYPIEEEKFDSKPKNYKVKSYQSEQNNQFSNNADSTNISKNSNPEASGKLQPNYKESTNSNDYTDESLIQLDDLKKGVIWQEILEPPRARRPYRKII